MALDIFFLEDIRNALLAANEASSATAEAATKQDIQTLDLIAEKLRGELSEDTNRVLLDALHAAAVDNVGALKYYRQGYRAALITVALAFGLSPAIVDGDGAVKIPASQVGERWPGVWDGVTLDPETREWIPSPHNKCKG